ncbi:MAG: endolytic transglycosylase MltG [Alphaproteobacteria bacterium]|nr:endolytic transglycosylase MltG [Alphaproteobacteria bacterium]
MLPVSVFRSIVNGLKYGLSTPLRRRLVLTIAILLVLGAVGVEGYRQFFRPGPSTSTTTIVVPRGLGINRIAELFADRGLLRGVVDRAVFVVGVKLSGNAGKLMAGEYEFPIAASMRTIMTLMINGETVVHSLTIAEGLTSAQVVAEIQQAEGLDGPLPVKPEDGTLLPETYHYLWGDKRQEVLARMRGKMTEAVEALWKERSAGAPDDWHKTIVLASIVEKETALATERPHIAAVFLNRLRLGMKLQSDPTVIYFLSNGSGVFGRPLSKVDLAAVSPYNTYLNAGLPPTPICNPGRASIAAVLSPASSDDLYFVADGTGGHVFAKSIKDHNRNVTKWRQVEKNRGVVTHGEVVP